MPSTAPARLLLLWDIDHTLIETRGVGFAIYQRAFPAATGRPLVELAKVSGRTELDIMSETLRINGVEPTDEAVGRLAAALVQGYEDARDELGTRGRALPGAYDTLAELATSQAVFQTVLTGNLREVARIKLEVFGLDRFLDLEAGSYGNDHQERAELVAIAQQRASERTGAEFGNEATVLIGDTPNDVAAGLAAGVRVVGVATGKTDLEELRAAGATWAIDEIKAVTRLLLARLSTANPSSQQHADEE
ncbi:HAD family hydrolase [Actinophytocola algeriensis]|uniref:Phosphoglycolate phosphatase-like HAD superfamily hydrolase n=1 Tax=Actinophytocola algeriensis TaxID=1768010 RepID=A0A7W7QBI5_9PSEU|nr:haloacid dehalogenase-like hydrolase [Actinophytocola algeriensis]MBB4910592.1 phosphoglycolate phosphatase-like HAD superfamily hydrolase [Actinophytocola algeriensis]MBE1480420.1 phosphoglycolate phosphatase-like HAD superfamily hydrolase [Actinophytocola algeriensis]